MAEAENEVVLRARGAGSTGVQWQGNVVLRPAAPWTPTVHSLLRHLEDVGFSGAPRVVGSGFAPDGRETLSYIEGEFTHPGPWTNEQADAFGVTRETVDPMPDGFPIIWGLTWRARSAAWIYRDRAALERAIR